MEPQSPPTPTRGIKPATWLFQNGIDILKCNSHKCNKSPFFSSIPTKIPAPTSAGTKGDSSSISAPNSTKRRVFNFLRWQFRRFARGILLKYERTAFIFNGASGQVQTWARVGASSGWSTTILQCFAACFVLSSSASMDILRSIFLFFHTCTLFVKKYKSVSVWSKHSYISRLI